MALRLGGGGEVPTGGLAHLSGLHQEGDLALDLVEGQVPGVVHVGVAGEDLHPADVGQALAGQPHGVAHRVAEGVGGAPHQLDDPDDAAGHVVALGHGYLLVRGACGPGDQALAWYPGKPTGNRFSRYARAVRGRRRPGGRPGHLHVQQEAGGQADGTPGGWKRGDQPEAPIPTGEDCGTVTRSAMRRAGGEACVRSAPSCPCW
jgi:hypothetical protein